MKFPTVLQSIASPELLVEFVNHRTGTVVNGDDRYKIGFITDGWATATDDAVWKELQPEDNYDLNTPLIGTTIKSVSIGSNDGSHNTFYDFPKWVTNIDTLAEYLQLDGFDFNVLKTLTYKLGKRHSGTNEMRELKKRLHYTNAALAKAERNKGEISG